MAEKHIAYLDPQKKLVDAVVEKLASEVQELPSGAKSLSHLLVVVPTAQAGRQLRLALAKKFEGAILSPDVKTPPVLLLNSMTTAKQASPAVAMSVLMDVLKSHGDNLNADFPALFPRNIDDLSGDFYADIACSLLDLWNILGENLLTMQAVAEKVPDMLIDLPEEISRWKDLSQLEGDFFPALHLKGYSHDTEVKQEAVEHPVLPPGITKIVLACMLDPLPAIYRFLDNVMVDVDVYLHVSETDAGRYFVNLDGDGWPKLNIGDGNIPALDISPSQIALMANPENAANQIASYFADIRLQNPKYELPALNLADETIFPALESAFLTYGFNLHNPASEQMRNSALGRMVSQMAVLLSSSSPDFSMASVFLRNNDVQRWLGSKINWKEQGSVLWNLKKFDALQQEALPQKLEDAKNSLLAQILLTTIDTYRGKGVDGIRGWLREIYKKHYLASGRPGDREFAAAAQKLNELLNDLSDEAVNPENCLLLLKKLISRVMYSLEPDDKNALLTTGWLEVAWTPEQEVVLAGMVEGAVPESIVGHPYLPDRLREELALPCNKSRYVRDAFILREIIGCREPEEVRIYCHSRASDGTPQKPSRLLLQCAGDAALSELVARLYAIPSDGKVESSPSLPDDWKLNLPPGASIQDGGDGWMNNFKVNSDGQAEISVTNINNYLESPFSYFRQKFIGSDQKIPANEIDALHFGNLAHAVMERFARTNPGCYLENEAENVTQLSDADLRDAKKVNKFLQETLDKVFEEQFGEQLSGVVFLQKAAISKTLERLADKQAERYANGWRIKAAELELTTTIDDVLVKGRADRIDYNEASGQYQIIDCKTWKKKDPAKQSWRDESGGNNGLVTAHRCYGIPTFVYEKPTKTSSKQVEWAWRSLQLPLYCKMFAESCSSGALAFAGFPLQNDLQNCSALYCILGTEESEYCEDDKMRFAASEEYMDAALKATKAVISLIKHGIFWPPCENTNLNDVYKYWKWNGKWPEAISPDWLEVQKKRCEGMNPSPLPEIDAASVNEEEN